MVIAFAVLLVIHGLIHVMGLWKAPALGGLWIMSALLFLAAAVSLFAWPRWWWAIGLGAIALSMAVIVPSWTDAKFGTLVNGVALVGVALGFLSQGPSSLRAEYERDVEARLSTVPPGEPITDADLAHLPTPVQRYLRVTGVVGQPRVRNYRVTMHGRIRGGRQDRWMPLAAEQHNFVAPPARLLYLNASMLTIPVHGYHKHAGAAASMRVKAAGLVPVATASGPDMTHGETVTLFNDMCLMAPATLIDPAIHWETIDARTVRARFTNAGRTIQAELFFNDAGELTNFVSDDRYQLSPDGKAVRRRWSTPTADYRTFGSVRLCSGGDARWHDTDGEYAYIELTFDDVQYNVRGW